jgi:mono/diheme cytochrome c family protein
MARPVPICSRLLLALMAALAAAPVLAEPPTERTLVHAVADADRDRIFVRWLQVEGTVQRFSHFEVLRRESNETALMPLNVDPIGAMTSVAEIQALFATPGYEDAWSTIQLTLGSDFANELLAVQQPSRTEPQTVQYRLLPDNNYGAAIAFGFGWMDETVSAGRTYVYEVWGLDTLGFREERLGRAVATAGTPVLPAPVPQIDCVDMGDVRGDMAVHLRWAQPPDTDKHYVTGYDVYRVPVDPGDDCTTTANGPGVAGSVRANAFPLQRSSGGRTKLGRELFTSSCASCHASPDSRNVPALPTGDPDYPAKSGVQGGNLSKFYRLQHAELLEPPEFAEHDTAALNALDPEDLRAVFDWIHEFHLLDDGRHTPMDPLIEDDYCLQVLPRDLLGQYGAPPPNQLCQVRDESAPQVPWRMSANRIAVGGTHEICEISWDRNVDADDDTVQYELYRMTPNPPRAATDAQLRVFEPTTPVATLAQPMSGERMTHQDTGLTQGNAGQRFVYAVQARDDAGNNSGFSGWVPCVPRDIVAPLTGGLTLSCCEERVEVPGCEDTRIENDWAEWNAGGGLDTIIFDPHNVANTCPGVTIDAPMTGDTFGARLYRSFDDGDYAPSVDFDGTHVEPFEPLIDTRVFVKYKPFDASGNLGPFSGGGNFFIVKGLFPLPPPQIVSATVNTQTDHLEIKFRSLDPQYLTGFVLYTNHLNDDGTLPTDIGNRVVRYANFNLSAFPMMNSVAYPHQWIVLNSALPLADRLPATGSNNSSLAYDAIDDLYILDVDPQGDPLEGLVLNLVAVGWSGVEGLYAPYDLGGKSGGVLEWPKFRTANHLFFLLDDLEVNVAGQTIDVQWTAHPGGCVINDERPFVVFRKRGTASRWEQISPLIQCDTANVPPFDMLFKDVDIEPGRNINYQYMVVRLSTTGEFMAQYGPDNVTP